MDTEIEAIRKQFKEMCQSEFKKWEAQLKDTEMAKNMIAYYKQADPILFATQKDLILSMFKKTLDYVSRYALEVRKIINLIEEDEDKPGRN